MFTGLIEEIGSVISIKHKELEIACLHIQSDLAIGDSVAVNGICLTVISFSSHRFKVEVMPITLRTTNLGALKPGMVVNLERAMSLNKRLGGHLVAGHIDATSHILNRSKEGEALLLSVEIPQDLHPFIVHKGSIALDGVSLTVALIDDKSFTVSLVGHTRISTILGQKQIGELINIECDQIGKYVHKMLFKETSEHSNKMDSSHKRKLDMNYLIEQGF